jgi:integrase
MLIELVAAYWNFAKEYYKNDPMRSDGHRVSIRGALDLIVLLFGETPVSEFGPLKFAVVLAEMIKPRKVQAKRRVVDLETGTSDVKTVQIERPGWTRGYANSQLKRLKRMFAWGVTRELLPPHICQALEMVEGLRKGKTAARESQPVRPARDEDVRKVLPLLPPPVRAMIKLEGLTAMRPGEARIMRGQDIELRQDVWIYRPQ